LTALDKTDCAKLDNEDLASWEKPNAFVVRGPRETPVLLTFDDDGNVGARGGEVEGVESMFSNGMTRDTLILVHVVEGDGTMLIKQLEVNKLLMEGKSVDVDVLVRMGSLDGMATRLRKRYIRKKAMAKKTGEVR
jgi:hypothetical protein